jgi:hypothetical protein
MAEWYSMVYMCVFSQLSVIVAKYLREINLKEERLIYRFQSVVTWFHCFWACGRAEHDCAEPMAGRDAYLLAAVKQRERKGLGFQ